MNAEFFALLVKSQVIVSIAWVSLIGLCATLQISLKEKVLRTGMFFVSWIGVIAGIIICLFAPLPLVVDILPWFSIAEYHYSISLYVTPMTAWFITLASFLFAGIATFSGTYLHRDSGYLRFFLLTAFAQLGVYFVSFSKSGDLLFFGWELVGLSSVLLIGYFQNHENAARQSVKAMVSYRIADAFLIVAMLMWHGLQGDADLSQVKALSGDKELLWQFTGLCLILGSLGKAGQFPFVTWLPRAMEGPTPSSALFYGAISVHLGPLLLLRTYDVWFSYPWLRVVLFCIGGITSIETTLVGRTRANVKGQLAYAVMGQIGLILMEIAFGFWKLALIHLSGHALLRTWQYLRASAFIQDLNENKELYLWFKSARFNYIESFLPRSFERWLYPHAVQGFHWRQVELLFVVKPVFWLANLLKGKK